MNDRKSCPPAGNQRNTAKEFTEHYFIMEIRPNFCLFVLLLLNTVCGQEDTVVKGRSAAAVDCTRKLPNWLQGKWPLNVKLHLKSSKNSRRFICEEEEFNFPPRLIMCLLFKSRAHFLWSRGSWYLANNIIILLCWVFVVCWWQSTVSLSNMDKVSRAFKSDVRFLRVLNENNCFCRYIKIRVPKERLRRSLILTFLCFSYYLLDIRKCGL